jgi:hypothetical protein
MRHEGLYLSTAMYEPKHCALKFVCPDQASIVVYSIFGWRHMLRQKGMETQTQTQLITFSNYRQSMDSVLSR